MQRARYFALVGVIAVALTGFATSASADRSTGASSNEALAELVSYVPMSHRFTCNEMTPGPDNSLAEIVAEASSVSTAVACADEVVPSISYYQFSNADAMNRVFLGAVTNQDTGAAGDDCPENGTWEFDDGTGGRIVCYLGTQRNGAPIPGTAVRLWTDDRTNILAIAVLPEGDADFAKLREWWSDDAGPTHSPDDDGMVDEVDADDEEALLASIPKPTRSTCQPIDVDEALADDTAIDRLYFAAAVECRNPHDDVDAVYYYKIDPDVIEDYLAEGQSPSEAELDEADEEALCPAYGTWSVGKGRKKREVGSYSCYFVSTDTGQYPVWGWTDTEQGIFASARGIEEDPTALHDWWQSDASGPLQG
jgi:hypothetical protein